MGKDSTAVVTTLVIPQCQRWPQRLAKCFLHMPSVSLRDDVGQKLQEGTMPMVLIVDNIWQQTAAYAGAQ